MAMASRPDGEAPAENGLVKVVDFNQTIDFGPTRLVFPDDLLLKKKR